MSQPGQSSQKSSLPGSVVPKNYVKFTGSKFRVHSTQRGEATELLDYALGGDDGCAGGRFRLNIHSSDPKVICFPTDTATNLWIFPSFCKSGSQSEGNDTL
jgi:hypothetical protein